MIIPFFLTRQTANLMEDFARELKQGPSLFLLYGENGVGKTRLLQELCQSRFGDNRIHWLDLGTGDSADGTRFDYSHGIEDLFSKADEGDIIVADHFEEALKKTRHQLFLSWSTDGIDKKLNLIVCSSNEGFNELRQLSQQYQVRVQSFQQMPFSADEVDSFLGFSLFPDQPAAKLKIPGPVRKQLAATQGNVGKIIEIIERDGKQIKTGDAAETDSIRQGSKVIVGVMLLFVFALGAGWLYLQGQDAAAPDIIATAPAPEPAAPTAAPEPIVEEAAQSVAAADADQPPAQPEAVAEAVLEDSGETEVIIAADSGASADSEQVVTGVMPIASENESDSTETAADLVEAEVEQADAVQTATASAVDEVADETSEIATRPEQAVSDDPVEQTATDDAAGAEAVVVSQAEPLVAEPGTVLDSEAVIEENPAVEQEQVASLDSDEAASSQPQSNWDRFALELKQSMRWIEGHEDRVGTVQILLLTFDTFDADVYYQYVANLARKNVDTGQLHVFKTLTGNKEVYSVFYGEYASRAAALGAIDDLPPALKDTSPIPRSVGGIWQEIRRLEAKN